MTHDPSWMGPQVTIAAAQTSRELRRQRDVELAAWCGQRTDDLSPFLRALQIFDVRSASWEMRVATEDFAHERLRRDLTAYWMRDELEEAA